MASAVPKNGCQKQGDVLLGFGCSNAKGSTKRIVSEFSSAQKVYDRAYDRCKIGRNAERLGPTKANRGDPAIAVHEGKSNKIL